MYRIREVGEDGSKLGIQIEALIVSIIFAFIHFVLEVINLNWEA